MTHFRLLTIVRMSFFLLRLTRDKFHHSTAKMEKTVICCNSRVVEPVFAALDLQEEVFFGLLEKRVSSIRLLLLPVVKKENGSPNFQSGS
jgi:isopenicillin N synthase-like dioxygenase